MSLSLENRRLEVLNLVALFLFRKGNCAAEKPVRGFLLYVPSYHTNICLES